MRYLRSCGVHLFSALVLAAALLSSPVLAQGLGGNAVADTAMVMVMPSDGSYVLGDMMTVEVWAKDVAELYGADIKLSFDPTRFSVLDDDPVRPGVQVTPGSAFLSPDLVLFRDADNSAGQIRYAVTQLNPSAPVSGSGVLFSFRLQSKRIGHGAVQVQQQQLATRDGELIPAGIRDASYWISLNGAPPKLLFLPLVLVGH
jgi:hypothetical protein